MTNLKLRLAVLVSFAAFAAVSAATETPQPKASPPSVSTSEQKPMDHAMMGGDRSGSDMRGMQGMKGMMDMMQSCQAMMNGMHDGASVSTLRMPPGNEKAEFEMRAEIMQKTGEIASKYASRIKVKE